MEHRLITEDRADQLVRTARTVMGERCRSVTYFTRDDYEQVYLREDLERDADLSSFIGVEWREAEITGDAYKHTELGDHLYTLRAFENGYLVRVTTSHDGVFVTTDGITLQGFDEVSSALSSLLDSWDYAE